MFLTNILLKKARSKFALILMESSVSGHKYATLRLRSDEKKELVKFDPYARMKVVYRECKRLRGFKGSE